MAVQAQFEPLGILCIAEHVLLLCVMCLSRLMGNSWQSFLVLQVCCAAVGRSAPSVLQGPLVMAEKRAAHNSGGSKGKFRF